MANKIKIEIKNKGKLLANASVLLNTAEFGQINIKAFQIWQSVHLNTRLHSYINIKPPSQRYFLFVFFEDEKGWVKLEKEIWESYQTKVAEESPIDETAINNSFEEQ